MSWTGDVFLFSQLILLGTVETRTQWHYIIKLLNKDESLNLCLAKYASKMKVR